MRSINSKKISITAMAIAINIVGSFLALGLRLPIYLDTIGTLMIALLLGPGYSMATGFLTGTIVGILFDQYAFYFIPVQILIGFLAGNIKSLKRKEITRFLFAVLILTLPASILAAIIADSVFGGVTSSGSSYIVQLLKGFGVPGAFSVFITQIFTDYADKFVSVLLARKIMELRQNETLQ